MRLRAIEAVRILNDFIADAVVGTRSIEIFDRLARNRELSEGTKVGIARMCYFHLILLLAKWAEFYDKYRSVIPADCANECRALNKKIKAIGVVEFRNKYIGHIWNNDTKQPLSSKDVSSYMETITAGDGAAFLRWVNDSGDNSYSLTVVGIISHIRDRLRAEYEIVNEPFEE